MMKSLVHAFLLLLLLARGSSFEELTQDGQDKDEFQNNNLSESVDEDSDDDESEMSDEVSGSDDDAMLDNNVTPEKGGNSIAGGQTRKDISGSVEKSKIQNRSENMGITVHNNQTKRKGIVKDEEDSQDIGEASGKMGKGIENVGEIVVKAKQRAGNTLEGSGDGGSIRGKVELMSGNTDEGSGYDEVGSGNPGELETKAQDGSGNDGEIREDEQTNRNEEKGSGNVGGIREEVEQAIKNPEKGSGNDEGSTIHAKEGSGNTGKANSGNGEAYGSSDQVVKNLQSANRDSEGANGKVGDWLGDLEEASGDSGGSADTLEQVDVGNNVVSSENDEEASGGSGESKESDKDTSTLTKDAAGEAKKQNVDDLLRDLVPSGVLPDLPHGFKKLSDISTVSFTYSVDEDNKITVTSDIKEPLELFNGKLTLTSTKMTFSYKDKEEKGQRWQFDARAKWISGQKIIDIALESSKHDNHFTLTGEGESLGLKEYASIFVNRKTIAESGMDVTAFKRTTLSEAEIYVVFKDNESLVSLVSGKVEILAGKPSLCKTYIQKLPRKSPVFAIMIDFQNTTPLSALSSVMDDKLSDIPFVKQLLNDKGVLKIANGDFGFAASSAYVDKLRLNVFGDGMLERQLGSRISSGVTLVLPLLIYSWNDVETYDMTVEISEKRVNFFPSKDNQMDVSKVLKTLSEFTRPKITSLGYPDLTRIKVKELTYDLEESTFTITGITDSDFNIIPGMLSVEDSTLEFKQLVPDEFATLTLYGQGMTAMGAAKLNVTVYTDSSTGELLIEGETRNLWSADIEQELGITMEIDDEIKKILGDNHMLNINIENARMYTSVKNELSRSIHFFGFSKPVFWNDPIEVEAVVFHDPQENKKRMTIAYQFDKLPLTYAIDAFSFGHFPSPRLLDNSRNTTLVLSPDNTNSMFLSPAMNGLSFMRGLSLVGQFRLPDVCSLNPQCESAAQLLGTEKWYRVQGLVSLKGYTLEGYVDKDFTLTKGLKLRDNIMEFVLGNYSYMSISTTLHLDQNNLTFRGYINFDNNGVRLRMSSNDVWSQPFPGRFVAFDRLQLDVPFVSGIPLDKFLITGEINFGLPGSLYRIFAPAYLTFRPSTPTKVEFQATLSNVSMETIISALNYKSTLPDVLRNSRFPDTVVVRYTPDEKKNHELELYGEFRLLERTLVCKMRIDENKRITATTSHSKYPLILDNGLVMVYADQNHTKLGPHVFFAVSPERTMFKVAGFATFMGIGTKTEIEVSESGTEFSLFGDLFGLTKTVVSIMSPDGLPDNGPYIASACIPEVIPKVVSLIDRIVASTADQAQGYVKQASRNLHQANYYHKEALAQEQKYKDVLEEWESELEMDDRDLFMAEERFNRTCREEQCDKTCIGCSTWHKCCDHDVFGNCVKCPGWKTCCWRGKSPICKAKNHGCRIMKQLAAENLQRIARRVYKDKEKKEANDRTLWQSEYLKGKTQAVLDAARRALNLVNHGSQVGLEAAASIKRFGLQRLVNIQSVCFQTPLKTLATSCLSMRINAKFADQPGLSSIPFYGCLNKEIVPKMATHLTKYVLADMASTKQQGSRSDKESSRKTNNLKLSARNRRGSAKSSIFRHVSPEEQEYVTNAGVVYKEYQRRRREGYGNDEIENRPFWLIRNNYQTRTPSLLQQRTIVPKSPLKKKWQIPASRSGKCKVYRQLVEICKDMMNTIKLMFNSYKEGQEQFLKRNTELVLGLNTTIMDLEKQAAEVPELKQRLDDIEMNIRTVNAGVNMWRSNCEADQEDQNKMAIREWVTTMEERIRKLGGQGVERFLSNLFRAFEGMFLGTDTPKNSAEEVLSTLQTIREMSATFHDIFGNNDITLEKANSRAEIVLGQLKHIASTKIFCD